MNYRCALVAAGTLLSAGFLHTSCWAHADQARKQTKTAEIRGYDYAHAEPQPSTESLDLSMYARIREEGFNHSHIMEYASALFDDIGPRLTVPELYDKQRQPLKEVFPGAKPEEPKKP
jgi:hypothetical protein